MITDWIAESNGGCAIQIKVTPRASKDELLGVENGRLRVRLRAPPVDGAANAALCGFLAETFKIPKRDVVVLAGETGRLKRVLLRGVPVALATRVLAGDF